MLRAKFTPSFKKSYERMKKRGADTSLLDNVIRKLVQGEKLAPKYKDHALTGNYIGFRECHVRPDWLLLYYNSDVENGYKYSMGIPRCLVVAFGNVNVCILCVYDR